MPATRERKLQQRLAAILFADVQGYSRLMGEDEESAHRKTETFIQIFRSQVKRYAGRIVQTTGDGVMAEFSSAVNAVRFAADIQRSVLEKNLNTPIEQRIEFRIGINLGEVIVERGSIYGDSVNIAARLESVAQPGGICISRPVYEEVCSKLPFEFEYLGGQRLKNIVRAVEAYRVRREPRLAVRVPTIRKEEQLPLPSIPSVAVLPFANLSGDPGEDFLSDGITEDITISLSKFRELFVISHRSAFLLKGGNVTAEKAGRDLGVRYILGGSVRRDGGRLRVSATLTDSESGHRLWGERYHRPVDDIFAVQDELTETIVATLAIQIAAEERRRAAGAETDSLRAYGLVLRAQQMFYQFDRQSNAQARWLYERALQLDSRYARAYAAMSRTFNLDWRYSWSEQPRQSLDKAFELANLAVEMDPFDVRGYSELGYVHLYRREHDLSIAAYERALQLNPNDADMMADMADSLVFYGRPGQAVELLKRAMRLNPFYPDWYLWHLGGAYYQMYEYEQAITAIDRMHNKTEGRRILAASYAQLGRIDEARAQAQEVLRSHPNFSLARWAEVQPDRNRDDTEHFIEGLRKAGLK